MKQARRKILSGAHLEIYDRLWLDWLKDADLKDLLVGMKIIFILIAASKKYKQVYVKVT